MFYFTCNESKIYESFTFEISYKKKLTFFTYSNFWDVPVFEVGSSVFYCWLQLQLKLKLFINFT